jgi:hypothetical protein
MRSLPSKNVDDDSYVDLDGRTYVLSTLDASELELINRCKKFIDDIPDWFKYGNFWMPEVEKLYSARGLSRREITKTIGWRIAEDLGSRLMIASGLARPSDYRDEIQELIRGRFRTRREFCEATGLSEDMLSHVLAKRKHLAIDTLTDALARIGYLLLIAPLPDAK